MPERRSRRPVHRHPESLLRYDTLTIPLTIITAIDTPASIAIDVHLTPKQKRPSGGRCCEPVVYPDVDREHAERMAVVATALDDPNRMQLGWSRP